MHFDKKKLQDLLKTVLLLIFVMGCSYILMNFALDKISENRMNELRDSVRKARELSEASLKGNSVPGKDSKDTIESNEAAAMDIGLEEPVSKELETSKILAEYQKLHAQNENFYGWLLIEGTGIDYPVMKGPDNEFYLSHEIDRRYDKYGMLVLDENSDKDAETANLFIYGHNVHDGDLFGELINYKDKGYYNYHPVIEFDDLYERCFYDVFAVLRADVTDMEGKTGFFSAFNYDDPEAFERAIKYIKENSLYDIDLTPRYGDDLLTLVTCEYTEKDGRFIVVCTEGQKQEK